MSDVEDEKYRLMEVYHETFGSGPPLWKMDSQRAIRFMNLMLQGKKEEAKVLLPDMTKFGPDGEIRVY